MKKVLLTTLTVLAGLGGACAHAQSADQQQLVTLILRRNAEQQQRLATELTTPHAGPIAESFIEGRQAALYRAEAATFQRGADPQALAALAERQERVIVVAASRDHQLPARQAAVDRLHGRVAAQRDAEQQRAIATAWQRGALSLDQVARLEAGQARLARMQYRLGSTGRESVEQALRLQHVQDIQDWAIATGTPVL